MRNYVAGFDPGGKRSFGWCVLEYQDTVPLFVTDAGVVSSAIQAKRKTEELCRLAGGEIRAIGVDAPLFWDPSGDRRVDKHLRHIVSGARGDQRTIMPVNSLNGACLIQGMMIAMLYRECCPRIPVTEAHPKAMLYPVGLNPALQTLASAGFRGTSPFRVSDTIPDDEHVRDAALAALCAWAMLRKPPNWTDLYRQFGDNTLSPLAAPLAYYFPAVL
ncbi:MAG: hypothetical protein ACE5O2_07625 [Armatimonadota bacterium]